MPPASFMIQKPKRTYQLPGHIVFPAQKQVPVDAKLVDHREILVHRGKT